jgi:hypothetical protein
LCFHSNFWIAFMVSVKNIINILTDITLHVYISLSNADILTMVFLIIHEPSIYLNLFVLT